MQEKQSSKRTDFCKICFKKIEDISFHRLLVNKPTICHHCFKESNPKFIKFKISNVNALALYEYDDIVKNRLFQFKGCFDYELKNSFLEYFVWYLKFHYFGYVIVPAPSSKIHDEKRGFNHIQEMYKLIGLKMINCIEKTKDFKQSDLTLKERSEVYKYLSINNGEKLMNRKILIVDDVYTTGSTVKAMIKLISKYSPRRIKVLLLAKTCGDY